VTTDFFSEPLANIYLKKNEDVLSIQRRLCKIIIVILLHTYIAYVFRIRTGSKTYLCGTSVWRCFGQESEPY